MSTEKKELRRTTSQRAKKRWRFSPSTREPGSATAAAALARELRAEERREESLDAELEAVLAKNSVEPD